MATDNARLLIQHEGKIVRIMPLPIGVLSIGRAPDNGLVLEDREVSRRHAELTITGTGAILADVNSSNGTYHLGIRLLPHQPQRLADGAGFQIGPFILVYEAGRRQSRPVQSAVPDPEFIAPKSSATANSSGKPASAHVAQPPRATSPVPIIEEHVSRYLRNLPSIFEADDFVSRFLLIFETIWEPVEQRQDHISMYFDPRTCPASFLPWLASWLNLPLNTNWPEVRKRHLVLQAMEIYRWRGTRYGLIRIIEIYTGVKPHISEDSALPFTFSIIISGLEASGITERSLRQLIDEHKPAHTAYRLEVQS